MPRLTDILKHLAGPTRSVPESLHVTYRHARPADADALATLAQLDSSRPLRGDVLVAESHGELWAAISLVDSHVIANPFRPSGELAFSLVDTAPAGSGATSAGAAVRAARRRTRSRCRPGRGRGLLRTPRS